MTQKKPFLPLTAGYIATFFLMGMIVASQGPLLEDLALLGGVTLERAALLFTLRGIGTLIGALGGSHLYDHLPSTRLLSLFLVMAGATFILVPVSAPFLLQLLLFTIVGFCSATLNTGGSTGAVRIFTDKSPMVINALHFSFGIGAFFIPMLIETLGKLTGNRLHTYWAMAALSLLLAVVFILLPEPPPQKAPPKPRKGHTGHGILILGCMVAFIFYVGAEVTLGGWIYNYVIRTGMGDSTKASLLNSLFWATFTLFRLAIIPIAHKVNTGKMLLVSGISSLGLLLLMSLFAGKDPWSLWLFVPLIGILYSPIFPTVYSFAQQKIGLTGKRAGLILSGGSIGGMSFPYIAGQLLRRFGPEYLPHILAVITAIMTVVLILLVRGTKTSPKP